MAEIPVGMCQCGCGEKTNLADRTRKKEGIVKGEPNRRLKGHNPKNVLKGEDNPCWKGGRAIDEQGYVLIRCPDHPKAHPNHYVHEHILIAEKALGKPLPLGAQVHHHNGKKGDNRRGNHVICQDDPYHKLLHQRTRAYKSCGHASWLKCKFCHEYDAPTNLIPAVHNGRHSQHHRTCKRAYERNRYHKKTGGHYDQELNTPTC